MSGAAGVMGRRQGLGVGKGGGTDADEYQNNMMFQPTMKEVKQLLIHASYYPKHAKHPSLISHWPNTGACLSLSPTYSHLTTIHPI